MCEEMDEPDYQPLDMTQTLMRFDPGPLDVRLLENFVLNLRCFGVEVDPDSVISDFGAPRLRPPSPPLDTSPYAMMEEID